MSIKEKVKSAPLIIRRPLEFLWGILPMKWKYGRRYVYFQNILKESEWASKEQHDLFQYDKLQETLINAYKNVPYYKNLFIKIGFNPGNKFNIEEFMKIPFLDKPILEEKENQLISELYDKKQLQVLTTGGTTGKQTKIYMPKGFYESREYPFVNSIWQRVGVIRGKSKVAQLRNQVLSDGKLWEYDYKNRNLIFDTYHLSDDNIGRILNKIIEWKAEYLHAYPSCVLVLCDYIKRNSIIFNSSLKAILAISENIYEGQKEEIEKYMGARCFAFYGHTECSVIAGQCECSGKYHINSEYGYFELIRDDGTVINNPDEKGEIVCTGFDNPVMPLIRYKTGDYASYSKSQECACGRKYVLLNNIEGRWLQEQLIGKFNNKIAIASVNMHNEIFDNIVSYQFEQNEIGCCILKIVKGEKYSNKDEINILKELSGKIGDSIDIKIEYVEEISRTIRGKQRFIINNILSNEN